MAGPFLYVIHNFTKNILLSPHSHSCRRMAGPFYTSSTILQRTSSSLPITTVVEEWQAHFYVIHNFTKNILLPPHNHSCRRMAGPFYTSFTILQRTSSSLPITTVVEEWQAHFYVIHNFTKNILLSPHNHSCRRMAGPFYTSSTILQRTSSSLPITTVVEEWLAHFIHHPQFYKEHPLLSP